MHFFRIFNFTGAGDVWFSLNGTTYQNNSCVALEDIGKGNNALLCVTNQTACCNQPYTGKNGPGNGTGSFPMELEFSAMVSSTEPERRWWYD